MSGTTKLPPLQYPAYCLVVGRCMGLASPELVGDEDDPALQQQRAQHLEEQPQAQTGEQTLKVHVLQT